MPDISKSGEVEIGKKRTKQKSLKLVRDTEKKKFVSMSCNNVDDHLEDDQEGDFEGSSEVPNYLQNGTITRADLMKMKPSSGFFKKLAQKIKNKRSKGMNSVGTKSLNLEKTEISNSQEMRSKSRKNNSVYNSSKKSPFDQLKISNSRDGENSLKKKTVAFDTNSSLFFAACTGNINQGIKGSRLL